MSQTVLYGGTFNPIHRGHLEICLRAREAVGAQEVLLMPAALPPHKSTGELAPDRDRLAMCALAAEPYGFISVDDYEIRRGGRSYTVDTLRYLTQIRPGEKFWLLMGTDMFLTFTQWRDWERIGELATLLVAAREEEDLGRLEAQKAALEKLGVPSVLLKNAPLPMSSTEIRRELRETGTTQKVSPRVLAYIQERGLYQHDSQDLPYLREYIRPLMTDYRYRHSLGVEKQAAHMAEIFGADVHKASVAGILHDVCKDLPKGALLQNILESGIINGIDFKASPQLIHGYAGALYIQTHLDIHDPDIIDVVTRIGRDPIRKLGPEDRFIGPMTIAINAGVEPKNIALGCAAALYFENPEDESAVELAKMRREKGIDYILENVSKLDLNGPVAKEIKAAVETLKQKGWIRE